MKWTPPKSPYNLLQESVWQDPWKIFVCCIFCNLTRRDTAEPYYWKFLKKWPTPQSVVLAKPHEIKSLIQPLGLSDRRTKSLIEMSKGYLKGDWKSNPMKLYGIGKYASDAYMIFCAGKWKEVTPNDHALNDYHNFLKKHYAKTCKSSTVSI